MLTTGLSAVGQIFVCDEGVMGFHNDRGTGGKMPAADSCEVILLTSVLYAICKCLIIRVFSLMFRKTSFKTPENIIKARA